MKTIEELKKEQYDAKAKLHELVEFINSEEYYTLSKSEQSLVSQERTGLELYLSILTKRVYGNPIESDIGNLIWMSLLYGIINSGSGFEASNGTYKLKESLDEKGFENSPLTEHAV